MKKTIYLLLLTSFSGFCTPVLSQTKDIIPIDLADMRVTLATAPAFRSSEEASGSPLVMELPIPGGKLRSFRVVESPIMSPAFAALYPSFHTYAVEAVDDAVVTGRISLTPYGFNGVIFTQEGMVIIRPLDITNPVLHEVSLNDAALEELQCSMNENLSMTVESPEPVQSSFSNSLKRTYSIAIVGTGEFYLANGGTVAAASAVVTSSINGIQAIYERELAVNFQLLTPFFYTNPATDPFSPGLDRTLKAAEAVEANFPGGNYDMGHVFHDQDQSPAELPGGGVAYLSAVCNGNALGTGYFKAGGWSGSFDNTSPGWIKLAAHEFGHMFNMQHTFNGTGSNCTSNISSTTAYEIASGNSIMSYSGLCSSGQNIPGGGTADHYFHVNSLDVAVAYMNTQTCHSGTPTGNNPPTVNASACGGPYTIPKSTPFRLTGTGTDPDGDQIYYSWEQYDEDGAGTSTQGYIGTQAAGSTNAPLFRSYPPTTSPTRTFPNMNLVAANDYASSFEPLPSVARTLNFRLTGRDWKPGGGGIHSSSLVVAVSASGPFNVTAPNGGETIAAGSNTIVTWDVNGTNVFCNNVNIKLSIDGGLTFPFDLAANTPNDGSQSVTIPANVINTAQARVMVECADNTCVVFFDISNNNFTLTSTCNPPASYICPVTAMSLPAGDPGLDLDFKVYQTGAVTSHTFNVTASDPTMNNVRWNNAMSACMVSAGTSHYRVFSFMVDQPGSYYFGFGSGNFRAVHLFADSFNPNGGCMNFIASSVVDGVGYYNGFPKALILNVCTVYHLVSTDEAFGGNTTVSFSGEGAVYPVFSTPVNYSYIFAAVNAANSQVASVSATANFTALEVGSYQIYGASYYSGPGPNPTMGNPADWAGNTIGQILAAGDCVLFSVNYKPLTVTGSGGNCPLTLAVNNNIATGTYQADVDLTSDGTVPDGNSALFKAGTSVVLQPNFEVQPGGVLTVTMEGCIPPATLPPQQEQGDRKE